MMQKTDKHRFTDKWYRSQIITDLQIWLLSANLQAIRYLYHVKD